jgi:transposase InsO family protein
MLPREECEDSILPASLHSGKCSIVNVCSKGEWVIESEQKLKGEDVVRVLNRLKAPCGVAKMLYCDSGREFSSQAIDVSAYQHRLRTAFSRPGKPTNNAFVGLFNRTFRAYCLNTHWMNELSQSERKSSLGPTGDSRLTPWVAQSSVQASTGRTT